MKSISILLAALILAGCSTYNPRFVPTAVHYNTVVEDTNNELLLLNVVRAKERRPMYFTRISAMRSNFTIKSEIGLGSEFGGNGSTTETVSNAMGGSVTETLAKGVDKFTPTLGGSYQTQPGFDYQILDSQEFFRGILSPISEQLISLYLQQGWPENLLTNLLFEKLVVINGDRPGMTTIVENDPTDESKLEAWDEFVSCYRLEGYTEFPDVYSFASIRQDGAAKIGDIEAIEKPEWSFTPEWVETTPDKDADTTEDESDADSEAGAEDDSGEWANIAQYTKPRPDRVMFKETNAPCEDSGSFGERSTLFTDSESFKDDESVFSQSLVSRDSIYEAGYSYGGVGVPSQSKLVFFGIRTCDGADDSCVDGEVYAVTRSIQGVIFYLGECIEAKRQGTEIYGTCGADESVISIVQDGNGETATPSLTVSLYGTEYSMAKAVGDDRSFQSLAFVNQLINLQKSASREPSTTTVRTVN